MPKHYGSDSYLLAVEVIIILIFFLFSMLAFSGFLTLAVGKFFKNKDNGVHLKWSVHLFDTN